MHFRCRARCARHPRTGRIRVPRTPIGKKYFRTNTSLPPATEKGCRAARSGACRCVGEEGIQERNSRCRLDPFRGRGCCECLDQALEGRRPQSRRSFCGNVGKAVDSRAAVRQHERRECRGVLRRWNDGRPHHRFVETIRLARDFAEFRIRIQRQERGYPRGRQEVRRALHPRGECSARWRTGSNQRAADKSRYGSPPVGRTLRSGVFRHFLCSR